MRKQGNQALTKKLLTPLADPPKLSVDGVTASVDAKLERLVEAFSVGLAAYPRTVRSLPRGYDHAIEFAHSGTDRVLTRIEYGDRFPKPNVYAIGTEEYNSPETYRILAEQFPGRWLPSRIDVALDWDDDVAFDHINELLVKFALRSGIELDQKGDWERGVARTRYLYSRKGQFYLRLYEYRAHHGYGPLVRLELEIKLKRDARARLADMHPWRMLYLCPATLHVLERLGLDDGPALTVTPGARAPQTIDRDLKFLANTAFPALVRLIAHQGGDMAAALNAIFCYRAEQDRDRAHLVAVVRERTLDVKH
jgi:hypothetical protein